MKKLNLLLDHHLDNVRSKFRNLPKSNKSGRFAEAMNMLANKTTFMENSVDIVNEEHNKMVQYINENHLDEYTDDQLAAFLETAKEKFTELIQEGLKEA